MHPEPPAPRSRRSILLLGCAAALHASAASGDPVWRARVTPGNEPGEPLIIRGRVRRTPGGSIAPGAVIMVYQTDAKGIYSSKEGRPIDTARLRAQFTSGPAGEYEIVTIRPGSYPTGGVAAHIHVNLIERGAQPREIFEFFFAGDPNLPARPQGYVLKPEKDSSGTWRATQDIALQP